MAKVDFDFQKYVAARRASGANRPRGGAAYAYSGDLRVLQAFRRGRLVTLAVEAVVRMWKSVLRNDLLGRAVKVTDQQFPRLYGLSARCAEQLHIPVPTVYVAPHIGALNAHTFGTDEESFVVLNAALVDHLGEDELLSVLGHECGHIQNNHVVYMTALYYLTNAASLFLRWFTQPAVLALQSWSRRAEVTCDRAGLICTRSLDTSIAALVKLALGSRKLYSEINLSEYLKQLDEVRQGVGKLSEMWQSHPYLPKRVEALRVFAQSVYYRELAGEAGGTTVEECDARVAEVLRIV